MDAWARHRLARGKRVHRPASRRLWNRRVGTDAAAATLSGGNQQKLVLGRELAGAPRVLVAEDPTRGLDVRAAESIHERIRAVAAAGAAVLFHSSDLDEVLGLADRVVVMSRGSLVVPPDGASRVTIGELMVTDAR